MTDEVWRPLGLDSEEEVASYDALHDGVPEWMEGSFWLWVQENLTERRRGSNGYPIAHVREDDAERMAHRLRITLPALKYRGADYHIGKRQIDTAMSAFRGHSAPLQIADFMLADFQNVAADDLEKLLSQSNSAWTVGTRAGKSGLVRRVALGVQVAVDGVIARAGQAGVRLAKAWELLYSLSPDPSGAYRHAILAVEDAGLPVVSPKNSVGSLGTMLSQMEAQADWNLPMSREHDKALSPDVVISMLRLLWHGQHDRHGGQPSAPGNVSMEEATVAVGLAAALVHWFDSGLLTRDPS